MAFDDFLPCRLRPAGHDLTLRPLSLADGGLRIEGRCDCGWSAIDAARGPVQAAHRRHVTEMRDQLQHLVTARFARDAVDGDEF